MVHWWLDYHCEHSWKNLNLERNQRETSCMHGRKRSALLYGLPTNARSHCSRRAFPFSEPLWHWNVEACAKVLKPNRWPHKQSLLHQVWPSQPVCGLLRILGLLYLSERHQREEEGGRHFWALRLRRFDRCERLDNGRRSLQVLRLPLSLRPQDLHQSLRRQVELRRDSWRRLHLLSEVL